jgi:hypothetical protein
VNPTASPTVNIDPTSRRRVPTILDGIILIAASAVGLALARAGSLSLGWGTHPGSISRLADGTRLASCLVLAWTVAFLPIRSRAPRPPWREVLRQPGAVACCAACLSVVIGAIAVIPLVVSALSKTAPFLVQNIAVSVLSNQNIAHSVAAAWMALALSGVGRGDGGWVDRMGMALGTFWLLALAFLASLALL